MAWKPVTGAKVLGALVLFFGLVISVNVTMATLAMNTFSGEEEANPYAAGLRYDQEIAAAQAQVARKWRVDAHVTRAGDGAAQIEVVAHDADGAALTGLKFGGWLERPATKLGDRKFELSESDAGVYRGSLADVATGGWVLVLEADSGDGVRKFQSREHLQLKAD
ncbi:MAG: FixH family protein [Alphaproteobacteria bacterium]|nr:FixH family protein [Alphaproteobacteria bacterium]